MEQPEGFDLTKGKDLVCKSKKALHIYYNTLSEAEFTYI